VVAAAGVRPLQPLEDSQDTHQILLPVSNIVYKEVSDRNGSMIVGQFYAFPIASCSSLQQSAVSQLDPGMRRHEIGFCI